MFGDKPEIRSIGSSRGTLIIFSTSRNNRRGIFLCHSRELRAMTMTVEEKIIYIKNKNKTEDSQKQLKPF